MKRTLTSDESPCGKEGDKAKKRRTAAGHQAHWNLGLKQSMEDPTLVIDRTDLAVIMKDKYPKVNPLNVDHTI